MDISAIPPRPSVDSKGSCQTRSIITAHRGLIVNLMFWKRQTSLMDQLIDAERVVRISRTNSIPDSFEIPLQPDTKSSGLSQTEEARYREILAILRYPLDGESKPNESDLQALSEKEQDRLEHCAILAAWDRFWMRDQVAPDSTLS